MRRIVSLLALGCLLAGCSSAPALKGSVFSRPDRAASQHRLDPNQPVLPPANSGRGGYYMDDGPGENPPPNLSEVPDAVVKPEPYSKRANRPYVVFGKTYTPIVDERPFTQRGIATWYGRKFHGQRTSSGELYDMYKMTAAHPTLPIPSFARVTSLDSGKSVVVRINDRGPFHSARVIDVSYTAALKLGLLGKGSHMVEVERLFPGQSVELKTVKLDEPAAVAHAAGFYLQLGAFSRAASAQDAMARVKETGVLSCEFSVAQYGNLHRLFCGPYDSRQDALITFPCTGDRRPPRAAPM